VIGEVAPKTYAIQNPDRAAKIPARPKEDHHATEDEERQIAEPHQEHGLLGVLLIRDQFPAFVLEVRNAARARTVQIREQRDHRAGQRRVLRFQLIDVIRDVLHAAGDVGRLVGSGREDVVSGNNARATQRQKEQREQERPAVQEREQSGLRLRLRLSWDSGWDVGGLSGQTKLRDVWRQTVSKFLL